MEITSRITKDTIVLKVESKQLPTDLFYLIRKNLDPYERRLRAVTRNFLPNWIFGNNN